MTPERNTQGASIAFVILNFLSSVVDTQIFTLFSIDFYEVLETTHNIPTLDINGIKWPGFLNLLFSCHIMLLVSMLRRSLSFTTF